MAGRLTGVVGKIEWSYYAAASINGYTVTRASDGTWALRATVVNANAYNMTQRPLIFIAPHQGGEWRWAIRTIRFPEGDRPPDRYPYPITAALDPPDALARRGTLYVDLRTA